MDIFTSISDEDDEDAKMDKIVRCATTAMQQYYPTIKTQEDLEDSVDLKTIYLILEYAAGIKMKQDEEESKKKEDEGTGWNEMDLAILESEVFLLGIWKDYEELESSLSMPELTATLNAKREAEYSQRKFLAAIQGVDLDEQTGKQNEWEEMKARVFSGGAAKNKDDILAFQGHTASKAGFGIGMGLSYEKIG